MSSPEWLDMVMHFAEPVGGAALGYLATALRYKRKIKSLDGEIAACRTSIDSYKKGIEVMVNAVRSAAIENDRAVQLRLEQQMRRVVDDITKQMSRLEKDLESLERTQGEIHRNSAVDHSRSAELAKDLIDVREQCTETLTLLSEIKGYLKASGAKF